MKILSIDAKDLYLSNYLGKREDPDFTGYNIRYGSGENCGTININRFINTLDYSLDLIKLREVYERVYRRMDFTFEQAGKEYCRRVVNVTFKYSVKEFNRCFGDIYVKLGYDPAGVELKDHVCIRDGELIAIRVGQPVEKPADCDILGKYFKYCPSSYRPGRNIAVNFKEFDDGLYIRNGVSQDEISIKDGVCVRDGKLMAVDTMAEIRNPISSDILGSDFSFVAGSYETDKAIKVVLSVAQLRDWLYQNGFVCDKLRFCRFKRSSGSSRVGKCLFVDEQLYSRMHRWELCGLKVKEGQVVDLAALEAYIALTLSSIEDTIQLRPENFLVVDDYTSKFMDLAVASRIGADGWLTSQVEDVEVRNVIWDGQSLIDVSSMGEYSKYGMVLLRNRFFKSACFNTNIQRFFQDNGITDVSQLNGFTLADRVEDIKIITTPSSIKYLKFGKLDEWLHQLEKCGEFGVVKHEKPTHFFDGRMVQIHYQLLNTLQLSQFDVDRLVAPSLDYLRRIQTDPAVMRYHIKYAGETDPTAPALTASGIVYKMLGVTDRFSETKLYRNFKDDVSKSFKKTLRKGHILVRGNYSTLLGNPVEMLEQAICRFDGESQIGKGFVYCKGFPFGKTLLGSRSPHVTMGNILLTENRDNPMIERYFNLTNEIVCINSIGENILMRLSGADFDSDTMLLTDDPILIGAARKNYGKFPVPTSLVEAKRVKRCYTKVEQADLDIKTSVNKIGEIVNLSQELNTKLWDQINNGGNVADVDELYCDISKLDVLSGIEIDKAKKEFAVDSVAEIRALKQKYSARDDDGRQIKPNFFGRLARDKGYYDSGRKNYMFHDTTMDYLQHTINGYRAEHQRQMDTPLSALLGAPDSSHSVVYAQVRRVIGLVRGMRRQIRELWEDDGSGLEAADKMDMTKDIKDACQRSIRRIRMNAATAHRLLLAIEDPKNSDIARTLMITLFSLPGMWELVQASRHPLAELVEVEHGAGELRIYNMWFRRIVHDKTMELCAESDGA